MVRHDATMSSSLSSSNSSSPLSSSPSTSDDGRSGRRQPLPIGSSSASHWSQDTKAHDNTLLFSSSAFPAPPRRQPPAMNDISFSTSDYYSDGSGGGSGSGGVGCTTFRDPGSTARALASLQQTRYERQERRRAVSLLALLLCLAVTMHVSSSGFFTVSEADKEARKKSAAGDGMDGGTNAFRAKPIMEFDDLEEEDFYDADYDEDGGFGKKREEVQKEEELEMYGLMELADYESTPADSDVPFFWHVPRCAGSTVKDIMGQCLGLTTASEVGIRDGHQYDETLQVIEYKGSNYINVDTTSLPGLERAKQLGLAASDQCDVLVSSYFFETADIFTKENNGRVFTLLRDPLERAVSMHYHLKAQNPALFDQPLADFARGNGIENNWMVRYLVNQMEGELDRGALDRAKEVLQRKFIIGLVSEKTESIARFQKYFNWPYSEDEDEATQQKNCIEGLLEQGVNRSPEQYELPRKGSQEWALITHQTQYDIKLYDFALELFEEQTKKWGTKEYKKLQKKNKKEKES